jgi:hypothetical protein
MIIKGLLILFNLGLMAFWVSVIATNAMAPGSAAVGTVLAIGSVLTAVYIWRKPTVVYEDD